MLLSAIVLDEGRNAECTEFVTLGLQNHTDLLEALMHFLGQVSSCDKCFACWPKLEFWSSVV